MFVKFTSDQHYIAWFQIIAIYLKISATCEVKQQHLIVSFSFLSFDKTTSGQGYHKMGDVFFQFFSKSFSYGALHIAVKEANLSLPIYI